MTHSYPPARTAWFVAAVFFLAMVLSYTDRLILNLMVDPIRQELSLRDTDVSLLQGAAFAVLYAFLGLPLGRYADGHNRRNLALTGVVIWSVCTGLCGLAANFTQLFIARVGVGVGEAALAPAAVSILSDYFPPHRRGTAIATLLAAMGMGTGVANLVGGLLLGALADGAFAGVPVLGTLSPWRAVLVMLAMPGAVIVGLLLLVREPERRERMDDAPGSPSLSRTLAYLGRHRATFACMLIALAMVQVVDYGITSWFPSMLIRQFGMTPADVGAQLGTVAILCGIVGALSGGVVGDFLQRSGRIDGKLRLSLAAAIALLPFLFFPLIPHATAAIVAFGFYTVVCGVMSSAGIAALQDVTPSEIRGLVIAMQAFLYTLLGLGLGPTLVALTTDHIVGDPDKVGLAIEIVVVPAMLLSIALLLRALPHFRVTRRTMLDAEPAAAPLVEART